MYLDRTLSLCYDETTPPQGGVCEVYAMKQKFDVTGMTCSACSAHVEKAVCKLEGVRTVQVNLLSNSMQVEYDEGVLSAEGISSAVGQAG